MPLTTSNSPSYSVVSVMLLQYGITRCSFARRATYAFAIGDPLPKLG